MTAAPTLRSVILHSFFIWSLIELSVYQAIESLKKDLQDVRTAFAPKRKFAFKKKPISDNTTVAPPVAVSPAQGQDQASAGTHPSNPLACADKTSSVKGPTEISSLSNAKILGSDTPETISSATVTDIQRSWIDLSRPPAQRQPLAGLSVKSISKSLLVCGTVTGAVHITDAVKCTLLMTSHQVRMHDCKDCVVYLRCSSKPIIENCVGIRFAPLPASYVRPSLLHFPGHVFKANGS